MTSISSEDDLLRFWFEETRPEQRFAVDEAFDERIRARFGPQVEAALDGARPFPTDDARGTLATIILLDQLPRNLHRGTPRAFAGDVAALALTEAGLAAGFDRALTPEQCQFFYMPLMHSEDPARQARSATLFEALGIDEAAEYARRHRDAIARFGRFPARNAALGRASTAAERAFLADHPEGF